jgi:plasmid stability protein
MSTDVLVRGMDEELYRRLKARAALRGMKISEAMEEAVSRWLRSEQSTVATEMDVNNKRYREMREELLGRWRGKYAVFCRGEFVDVFETLEEAGRACRDRGVERALLTKVGEEESSGGGWLWGSLQLGSA